MTGTHDPTLRSWVESANLLQTDFPIQNLPFGVFKSAETEDQSRIGVAIGDQILDLAACCDAGLLESSFSATHDACAADSLNGLMALGRAHCTLLRSRLSELLRIDHPDWKHNRERVSPFLSPMKNVAMQLPANIGDYTDFYSCIYHASNVGSMFRPENPLLPNYKYVPIAYHGRVSSIIPSGSMIRRPVGQSRDPGMEMPYFGASRALDYELEVGFFVAEGNHMGKPIPIDEAEMHIFGLCLLNDWSARDIQAWEYQPLGPFLAKSFGTTISTWLVTMDALEPFRVPAFERAAGDPVPLPYLSSDRDKGTGGIDLTLELYIASQQMRESGFEPLRLSRGNLRDLYWTLGQMVTHHTSNGCNLRPADLIGSGTISGVTQDSLGSLIELTKRGATPLQLPTGESRKFIENGDEIIIRGYCERDGYRRIGFGECRGKVVGD